MHSRHMRFNHLLAKAYTGEHSLFPLSTGQDWANKRVSGSDGGDGQRQALWGRITQCFNRHSDNHLWQELQGGS